MAIRITGGNGFVMSNFARHWIENYPEEKVVIVDAAAPDQMARDFFASIAHQIRWVEASILEPEVWTRQVDQDDITHVVHGATLTPHPYTGKDGVICDPERERPRRVLDVNVMGTVEVLEWARSLKPLHRFLYVSTGSVYSDEGPTI